MKGKVIALAVAAGAAFLLLRRGGPLRNLIEGKASIPLRNLPPYRFGSFDLARAPSLNTNPFCGPGIVIPFDRDAKSAEAGRSVSVPVFQLPILVGLANRMVQLRDRGEHPSFYVVGVSCAQYGGEGICSESREYERASLAQMRVRAVRNTLLSLLSRMDPQSRQWGDYIGSYVDRAYTDRTSPEIGRRRMRWGTQSILGPEEARTWAYLVDYQAVTFRTYPPVQRQLQSGRREYVDAILVPQRLMPSYWGQDGGGARQLCGPLDEQAYGGRGHPDYA